MKITDLTLYKVPPRWLFLKISTDEGIDGWGEPVIEGRADTVRTAVEEFRNYLIGKDPANIEDHWQVMYRCGFYRGGPEVMSAIAGIDQALWDIKGKKLGVPVYEMLGGACRDKLRVYRWIGGDRPSDIKANVLEAKAQGYSAIKMNATEEMHYIDSFKKIDAVCERVAIIRDTLGMDMDIAVDFHGRVHKTMARVLAKELDQFHLMFIEEPVLSQNNEAMRDIRQATCTDCHRRAHVQPLGIQKSAGSRLCGYHPARSFPCGRYQRVQEDCSDGRSLRCGCCAALPAWPDCLRRVRSVGFLHA